MKGRPFLGTWAAVIVLAALGAYIYFVESKRDPSALEDGKKKEKVFAFDKAKVKGLVVASPGEPEVRLVREKDAWRITAPMAVPADATEASAMVTTLETLESDEVVAESAADLAQYGLATPRATISLEVEGQPRPLVLALGEKTPDGGALYARVPSAARVFTLPAYVEASLVKKPFDLRDRDVLHVKRDDVRALEVTGPQGAYALARDDKGIWAFTAPLRTAAGRWSVDALLGTLENLRMESVAAEEAADAKPFGLAPPQRTVTLALTDGHRKTLEIGGSPAAGKHHARVAGSPLVAVIPGAVVEDLAKGMAELRARRMLEVSSYEVEGFDAEAAGVKRVYARSKTADKDGGDTHTWKRVAPDAKDVAASAVQDALFAVGGLEVQEFVDAPSAPEAYGLAPPALRVTLRATGGKPPSWFEIGEKDGTSYARRNDDAAVLKVDPAKAKELLEAFKKL